MSNSSARYSSAILVLVMPGSSVHHISGLRLHGIQFLSQGLGLHCPVFVISFTDAEEKPVGSVNVEYLFWTIEIKVMNVRRSLYSVLVVNQSKKDFNNQH
jgi:hypothetical protein